MAGQAGCRNALWGAYYYGHRDRTFAAGTGQAALTSFLDNPGDAARLLRCKRFLPVAPRATTAATAAENHYTRENEVDTTDGRRRASARGGGAFDILV